VFLCHVLRELGVFVPCSCVFLSSILCVFVPCSSRIGCFCAMFFESWVFLSLDNWDLGGRVLCVFVYSIS